jgi:hypothetical protein
LSEKKTSIQTESNTGIRYHKEQYVPIIQPVIDILLPGLGQTYA